MLCSIRLWHGFAPHLANPSARVVLLGGLRVYFRLRSRARRLFNHPRESEAKLGTGLDVDPLDFLEREFLAGANRIAWWFGAIRDWRWPGRVRACRRSADKS